MPCKVWQKYLILVVQLVLRSDYFSCRGKEVKPSEACVGHELLDMKFVCLTVALISFMLSPVYKCMTCIIYKNYITYYIFILFFSFF